MHELSIAEAMLTLALKHVPSGGVLRSVTLRCGPLRAIDPDSMQWAWQSITADRGLKDVKLKLDMLPWLVRCPECDKEWSSEQFDPICRCGCRVPELVGGDELKLISVEVEDPTQPRVFIN